MRVWLGGFDRPWACPTRPWACRTRAVTGRAKRITISNSNGWELKVYRESGRSMLICWRKGKKARWSKKHDRQKKNEQGRAAERAGVITRLLKNVEKKLSGKEVKATLGDYIRLVQLQKELDEEQQPTEIKVTWVDAEETKSGSEE
jgi:hypothetical protein